MRKTAYQLVEESFEKMAYSIGDSIPEETLKKLKEMSKKEKTLVEKLRGDTGNGTNFKGKLNFGRGKVPPMPAKQVSKMGGKTKAAIGAGAATATALGTAYAYNKLRDKKEKTAQDLVEESFEKMAATIRVKEPLNAVRDFEKSTRKGQVVIERLKRSAKNGVNFDGKLSLGRGKIPPMPPKDMSKINNKAKALAKARGIAGNAALALGTSFAYNKAKDNKEKTAQYIIEESFEKIAKSF